VTVLWYQRTNIDITNIFIQIFRNLYWYWGTDSLSTDRFKTTPYQPQPKIYTEANKSGARVNLEKPNEETDIQRTLWLSTNLMTSLPCQKCFVAYMQIGYLFIMY